MQKRFEVHSHTDKGSNIRLIDCINKIDKLIDRARENGLCGIAITDHEALCNHMAANKIAAKLKDEDFKVALGNEIYLVDERTNGQKYYHFILIAKDMIGYKQLRKLSTNAWYNSYMDRALRVPTLKSELETVINQHKGHLIATSACLGGELSTSTMNYILAQQAGDMETAKQCYAEIISFIELMKKLFNDDFYIECAPGCSEEQLAVNSKLKQIAQLYNIKMVIGTDAHFLKKEDRFIHKSYLKSKDGEREVDAFYEYSYLQTEDEIKEHLSKCDLKNDYEILVANSVEIYNKIEFYDIRRPQVIPTSKKVIAPEKKIMNINGHELYSSLFSSEDEQARIWANDTYNGLKERNINTDKYISQLETEAEIIISLTKEMNLTPSLFTYFNTFKHYIDLFWECGSIVGPGRGSATGFLSDYALDITQLDPLEWNLQYWRFLNKERVELPSLSLILGSCKKRA